MRRSARLAVLAAIAGLALPVVASDTPVSAVDQDLVLSATSGAPRDEFSVSSASCDTSEGGDGSTFRYLYVRLIVGPGPSPSLLAGTGIGADNDPAVLVVPDWVDPSGDLASVNAQCVEITFPDTIDGEPVVTRTAYDAVPFDLEAGADAPVQTRTYSRTSLQAGQAFSVSASGCFLDDANSAYVDVSAGDDLTFSTFTSVGLSGGGDVEGDGFDVDTALSNGDVEFSLGGAGTIDDIAIEEIPTDIPAGEYSTVAYCTNDAGTSLVFEPDLIEVTGNAPFGDIDLTVDPQTQSVALAGGSCTSGDASAFLFAEDLTDAFEPDIARAGGSSLPVSPAGIVLDRPGSDSLDALTGAKDRVVDDGGADVTVTPAADGAWSLTDAVAYPEALAGAFGQCGDPLGDGFLYDPQAAVLDAAVDTTTTVPTTVPVPVPAPANAVSGNPTYAG